MLCGCRNHHFVVDGPVQNGCPGEAVTPGEIFLAGVAACGVELVQVIAKERGLPLKTARVAITGEMDRANPVRRDFALFNSVRLRFDLMGVTPKQAKELVEAFKGR
ncbi:MAG TPA: OsmC family protein [Thermoanaerobaculia bacterium]|nr:OsmC family protein [Thermoanaerobaculia bacterium]